MIARFLSSGVSGLKLAMSATSCDGLDPLESSRSRPSRAARWPCQTASTAICAIQDPGLTVTSAGDSAKRQESVPGSGCCYARQDKFWVKGAPGGERWEIYAVTGDSATFWGDDDGQGWEATAAELDDAHRAAATGRDPGAAPRCCGASAADEQAGAAAHT